MNDKIRSMNNMMICVMHKYDIYVWDCVLCVAKERVEFLREFEYRLKKIDLWSVGRIKGVTAKLWHLVVLVHWRDSKAEYNKDKDRILMGSIVWKYWLLNWVL